jgi:hypothetical protein
MEAEVVATLQRIARLEGITMSELVRRIVLEWLESEARTKYGMKLVFDVKEVEAVADGLSSSDPLSAEVAEDFMQTVEGMFEEVKRATEEIDAIHSEVKELERFKDDEIYSIQGRGLVRGVEVKHQIIQNLYPRFNKADKTLRAFFAKVYYPWLRMRREVTIRDQIAISQKVAVLYRRVRKIRGKWMELRLVFRGYRK